MGSGLSGVSHTQIRGTGYTGHVTGNHGPPPSCGTHGKGLEAKVDPVTCGGARRQTVKCVFFDIIARGSSCSTPLDIAMVACGSSGEGEM